MSTDEASAAKEIDAIITAAVGWRGATLAELRRVIVAASPDVVEDIKWKKPSRPEGVATWVCDGNLCTADILKNAVRLTFPKGARVEDPDGLFNTRLDSNSVRAVDFFENVTIDEDALRGVVQRAIAVNRGS
jgi:hypothetical protein